MTDAIHRRRSMSRITIGASLAVLVALAAAAAVLVIAVPASAASSQVGVGFNAPSIAGFPGGKAFLTGGGAYDPASASNADPESAFVRSNGGFRCLADVKQGPLTGCLQGQGVRWDTDGLLKSTRFKCTGAASEPAKTAVTDAHTEVLVSDFYRAGDGNDASFKGVQVIVSDHDLAGDIAGLQNVWIQQVGCGTANVNFSS
jgi:opacity protein-like surface antigen